jgi:hypothetical protein
VHLINTDRKNDLNKSKNLTLATCHYRDDLDDDAQVPNASIQALLRLFSRSIMALLRRHYLDDLDDDAQVPNTSIHALLRLF